MKLRISAWVVGPFFLAMCAGAASQPLSLGMSTHSQLAIGQASISACSAMPPMPTPPNGARNVLEFGAIPNDDQDDTVAIQNALNSLEEGEWLVFPPGKYLHSLYLEVTVRGAKLFGDGAQLHATNPESMAVILSGDHVGIYGFKLTAETDIRKSSPKHARIVIKGEDRYRRARRSYGVTVSNNTIVPDGRTGERYANSSSASGIYVSNAFDFTVSNNTISRTLADGIHVTGGSEQGRILGNRVGQTGDDMIGLVSYGQDGNIATSTAAGTKAKFISGTGKNKNILVQGNILKDNYSGRGIGVVGGEGISVLYNEVLQVPGAAGILLAREPNWMSHGLSNVLVRGNMVSHIQTGIPPGYNVGKSINKTGHGAIEVHSFMFDDEFADDDLRRILDVDGVIISENTLQHSGVSALRVGVPENNEVYEFPYSENKGRSRHYRSGIARRIEFRQAKLSNIGGMDFKEAGTEEETISCSDNRKDGELFATGLCVGPPVVVTGAVLDRCIN